MLCIDFINVGYGDAILIRQQGEGEPFAMLVDCGNDTVGEASAESCRITAADFLKREGVEALDLLVLTHLHSDHIRGLSAVLSAVSVRECWCNYLPDPSINPDDIAVYAEKPARGLADMLRFLCTECKRMRNCGTVLKEITAPMRRQLTDRLTLDAACGDATLCEALKRAQDAILAGAPDEAAMAFVQENRAVNRSSLRLSLGYAGRRIDLPGDSYGCYLEALPLEKADILKVPHHACKNAVSEAYLQKLCPTYAVVSVSDNYQKAVRPHEESVQLLERYAEKLLFTDAVGTKKHPPRLHSVVRLCIEPDGRICYNETV